MAVEQAKTALTHNAKALEEGPGLKPCFAEGMVIKHLETWMVCCAAASGMGWMETWSASCHSTQLTTWKGVDGWMEPCWTIHI